MRGRRPFQRRDDRRPDDGLWEMITDGDHAAGARLDAWLDISCLFRTRSEAQKAVRAGKVAVNGQSAKPNRKLREGDELTIARPFGRKQTVRVVGFADRHIARADARRLYEDLTPAPTPEEIELRRQERLFHAAMTPPQSPDKRARRALRRMCCKTWPGHR